MGAVTAQLISITERDGDGDKGSHEGGLVGSGEGSSEDDHETGDEACSEGSRHGSGKGSSEGGCDVLLNSLSHLQLQAILGALLTAFTAIGIM